VPEFYNLYDTVPFRLVLAVPDGRKGAEFYLQKGGAPKAQFVELSDKIHAETAPIHIRHRKNVFIFPVYNVQALHGPGGRVKIRFH
jgi:hypothetical protein